MSRIGRDLVGSGDRPLLAAGQPFRRQAVGGAGKGQVAVRASEPDPATIAQRRAAVSCQTVPWLLGAAVLALASALSSLAGAVTLHVDQNNPQCTDSGPGTAQQPFCTISAAVPPVAAGDTVIVRPGIYGEGVRISKSGTASAPIVFSADNGVTMTGTFDLSGSQWMRVEGFTISGSQFDGIKGALTSNITLSDNRVIDAGEYGIFIRNASDILISNNAIDDSGVEGVRVQFSANVTVTGNLVARAGEPVVGLIAKGIYIRSVPNALVSDNIAEANSDAGIFVFDQSTGTRVKDNITRHNAREFANATAGIDLRFSNDSIIEGNMSHENEDSGINVRGNAINVLVVNNLSHDNGDHGIDFLSAPDGRIIGNTVYRNHNKGLEMEDGSSGMTVANNICVDNGLSTNSANIRTSANSVAGSTADHNLVHRSAPGVMYTWGDVNYASLDALRAAHPALEINGIEGDPDWVAPGSGDFGLSAGSPAIDSADSGISGALAHDLEGNGRVDDSGMPNTGVGPRAYDDRGAFEFQGTSPPSNTPPEITSGPTATPNPLFSDETSELAVEATDADGDPLDYNWSVASGGGSIEGTGPIVTYLPPAVTVEQTFTVTVEVIDSFGGLDTGTVDVTVRPAPTPANTPPEIASGPTATPNPLFSDETAELTVTATDADDDPLGYGWSVPPGGGNISGSGPTVTYFPPAVTESQTFTISVEVSDGRGGLDTGTVDVTVDPAPVGEVLSFRPVADAWVDSSAPDTNRGGGTRLSVDASPVHISYLRFEVTGLTSPVQSALLQLQVANGSPFGGTIHAVSDNGWDEFTITYNNRPAVDGPALDNLGAVSVGAVVELDITSAIQQDGQYSFAIDSTNRDGVEYRSREGSTNTPMLFIALEPTS
jgi:parallel beta-helix repeat protein